MAEIQTYRLPAKPRNKRLRYIGGGSSEVVSGGSSSGGGKPTYWSLVAQDEAGEAIENPYIRADYDAAISRIGGYIQIGETRLTEAGDSSYLMLSGADGSRRNFLSTGDVVAYASGVWDLTEPIAGANVLGMVKIGSGISISEDGTISTTGGGGGGGGVTDTERANWNTAYTQTHTHPNKTILDGITDTLVANWNTAYTNNHTHPNKTILDGITDALVTNWNDAYTRITAGKWWGQTMDAAGVVTGAMTGVPSINALAYFTASAMGVGVSSPNAAAKLHVGGNILADGDIVAYQSGIWDLTSPIAGVNVLGMVKQGANITISADGTISSTASGGGITETERANWNTAYTQSHTHSNKAVLDGITSALVSNWNTAYSNYHTHSNKTVIDGITATLVSNWNTAYTNSHTHSNKTVLDGITATLVSNWNTAYTNNHTHSNKAVLDGITSALVSNWNKITGTWWGQSFGSGSAISGTISNTGTITPSATNTYTLGAPALRYANVYATTFTGALSGNATTATTLAASRTLWGQPFNGSANVSGNMTGVGSITASGTIQTTADVVAYMAGGSSPMPFTYWKPSVDANGNLSWANTTSETTPATVNIKGPEGGAVQNVQQWTAAGVYTTYTSGIAIRCGYRILTGSIAAGQFTSSIIWEATLSSTLSLTASLDLTSANSWTGYNLICTIGRDTGNNAYRINIYNPSGATISLSDLRVSYIALMRT